MVLKKKMYYGLLTSIRKKTRRHDGTYVSFGKNTVIALNESMAPIGNRLSGPICKEILKKSFRGG